MASDHTSADLRNACLRKAFRFAVARGVKDLVHPDQVSPALAKRGDHELLMQSSCTGYSGDQLLAARQYYALVRKDASSAGAVPAGDRKRACFDKFRNVQKRNRITEKRLNFYFTHPSRMRPLLGNLLATAQMEVFRLMGPCPTSRDWKAFVEAPVFSGGVSQGLSAQTLPNGKKSRHKDTNAYAKLGPDQTVTATDACLRTFGHLLCNGAYGRHLLTAQRGELVSGSKGTSVYKDAEVDRFIAIEPLLNGMAQQGIRAMLGRYLWRWGITLDNQKRNQELARVASTRGLNPAGWSTIDLSSASDTITRSLVEYLIPKGWLRWLNAARTETVTIEGDPVAGYASYCTMGNAFTFPLQCIVFASLTRAAIALSECGEHDYRVYGDDIIVPSSASLLLIEALKFVGFVPNVTKSFVTGFFRESCGGDYLNGDNVTPAYVRDGWEAMTSRHVLFNTLQRRIPEHPILFDLIESAERPLVGPPLDSESVAVGHFEAPLFAVRQLGRCSYDSNCQAVVYRFPSLYPVSVKVYRNNKERALLASISGSPGERHDLRGSVRYHVRWVETTLPQWLGTYSPTWYNAE